jgi:hypothetical protein
VVIARPAAIPAAAIASTPVPGPLRAARSGPQRRIEIRSEGSQTLVVWNPGAEAAAKMADVGAGWRDYVCLEVANAGPSRLPLRRAARHAGADPVCGTVAPAIQ